MSPKTRRGTFGPTVACTMAALLLAGFSAASGAREHDDITHVVASDEAAVAATPHDATLRATLGHAYLRDGRFESAAAALGDAQTLGDTSSRTVLGLALADIAVGRGHDAVALLDSVHNQLPVTDLGLALALAGETGRGVAILADALRTGPATQTLRQNLAYAYALDGRWNEARTLAMLDLSGDKVDARLTQWAATARPEAYRARVAALLGAPMREDAGMPVTLALAPSSAPTALAVAAPVGELPASAPTAAPLPAAAPMASAEPVAPTPVVEPIAQPPIMADAAPTPRPAQIAPSPAEIAVAHPVRAPRHARPVELADAAPPASVAQGGHMIQIGAFLSQANAEHARRAFATRGRYPGHAIAVSQASVGGRTFWRVTVAGFATASAANACDSVKAHGGACFAYAGSAAPEALAMAGPNEMPGGHSHRR